MRGTLYSSDLLRDYSPPPIEPDYSSLMDDYVLYSEDYPGAWTMCQFLKNMGYCAYSEPTDDFYLKDGVIHSNWVVFFSCRPRDAERLGYIASRTKYHIWIGGYT